MQKIRESFLIFIISCLLFSIGYGQEFQQFIVDAALVHSAIHDKFKLVICKPDKLQLEDWLYRVRWWIAQIERESALLAEASPEDHVLKCFPKNTDSCQWKYGQCPYLDLCQGSPNPLHYQGEPPAGYVVSRWSPLDHAGASAEGRGLDN